MTLSLRLKFGFLIMLVICWCFFVVYLVTSLEFQWMPQIAIIQPLQIQTQTGNITKYRFKNSLDLNFHTTRMSVRIEQNMTPDTVSDTPATSVIQVVMATDGSSLGGLIAAINSILSNTKHRIKFHIVITEEDLPHLKTWIQSSKLHSVSYESHTISPLGNNVQSELEMVKIRFGIIFPNLKGRVIYMDNDVIVQGDIWKLHSVTIDPNTYGAFSKNCTSSQITSAVEHLKCGDYINIKNHYVKIKDINEECCPFSSGVFVVNVTEWRNKHIFEKLQNWVEIHSVESITGTNSRGSAVDTAMLLEFYGKVSPLEPNWHVQHLGGGVNSRYSKQYIEQAKLLHWSGKIKPWQKKAAHSENWDRYFVPDPTLQFRPLRRHR